MSGVGLDAATDGVDTIVDATNVVGRAPDEILHFFETSTSNLVAAGRRAGVRHHIALSVVGADRMPDSPYMRGKVAQERVLADGGVPFTIVRATQFFEFVASFPAVFAAGADVHVPQARIQPIAIENVVAALAMRVGHAPANGIVDVAGPRAYAIRDAVARVIAARGEQRSVTASSDVRYFGAKLEDDTLLPLGAAGRGVLELEEWLSLNG